MIDIGFTKIALIFVVALVVIGPEKLPAIARMAGSLFGRAQRYLNEVKAEVSREMALDELRQMRDSVEESVTEVVKSVQEVEHSIARTVEDTKKAIITRGDDPKVPPQPLSAVSAQPSSWQPEKAKTFRRKKTAHTHAVPMWYKRQNAHKTHITSASARVAAHRPAGFSTSTHSTTISHRKHHATTSR